MMDWIGYAWAGLPVVLMALTAWVVSLVKNDVSIVDSLWSLFVLVIGITYLVITDAHSLRANIVLLLVAIWALRLAAYITLRNHGEPEDYRYQEIRKNNQPGFQYKSLYIVFGLQAVLAWIIAMPVAVAMSSSAPLGWLDGLALLFWVVGMFFEVVGDAQLSSFRQNPDNDGKVLDSGLWRYTRHPNYFGEFALWWGYFLFAVAAGGWWTLASPLILTFMLLRVSGVSLLEKDIGERRPAYAEYIRRTNAFIPGPPKAPSS